MARFKCLIMKLGMSQTWAGLLYFILVWGIFASLPERPPDVKTHHVQPEETGME
jgi:hypothetical protein